MKYIEFVLEKGFLAFCAAMAVYMTGLQFQYYFENEDQASISFRKFNSGTKDKYPTFTLCLNWKNQKRSFGDANLTFLSGNSSVNGYLGFLRGLITNDNSEFTKFERLDYDVLFSELLNGTALRFMTSFTEGQNKRSKSYSFSWPPIITHQDDAEICYSKNVSYQRNLIFETDFIHINASKLQQLELSLDIYIHEEGQFLRNEQRPVVEIAYSKLKDFSRRYFDINGGEILRKREKAKTPCDQNLINEDNLIRNTMIKNVGCIPAYWARFASNVISLPNQTGCTQQQYHKLQEIKEERFPFQEAVGNYSEPCTEMKIEVNYAAEQDEKHDQYSQTYIKFYYRSVRYKEILNTKAYTIETLCGQVGGFVGNYL